MKLIIAPDDILACIAEPVRDISDKLIRTMHSMVDLMYRSHGIGLAAPQINISHRFFVMHIDNEDGEPYFFVNPAIISKSRELSTYEEGCLSVPGQTVMVERPACVSLEYMDLKGNIRNMDFEGISATCVQHEIDHLDGVIILDHISSPVEKELAMLKAKETKAKLQ